MRMAPGTAKFLVIWSVLAGATIATMLREEAPPPVTHPIAQLAGKTGEVDYRPDELLLWQSTKVKQAFGNGDRIATGPGGSAKILLEDGRTLEIGDDALIVLSQEPAPGKDKEMTMVLTVTKGTLKVKSAPPVKSDSTAKNRQPRAKAVVTTLKINVDNQAVELAADAAEVKIEKKIDAPVRIQQSRGVTVTVAPPPPPPKAREAEALPTAVVAAAEPPPPLVADGFEPDLEIFGQRNPPQLNLWTLHDLSRGDVSLPVSVLPPRDKTAPDGSWTPLVRTDDILLQGEPRWGAQILTMPVASAAGGTKRATHLVQLVPGVRRAKQKQEARSFSQRSVRITMQSLGSLESQAVSIFLDTSPAASTKPAAGWFIEDPTLRSGLSANVWQITLASGTDLLRLLPYIQSARAVKIQGADFASETADARPANWLVRGRTLVAKFDLGSHMSIIGLDNMVRQLGADLAFHGAASSLLKHPVGSSDNRLLYVANRVFGEPFYHISGSFLGAYHNAATFVEATGLAFFMEPVVVLVNRTRPHAAASDLAH